MPRDGDEPALQKPAWFGADATTRSSKKHSPGGGIVPERVGNLAWGDADGKTLYIVASTSVYRIRTEVGGINP